MIRFMGAAVQTNFLMRADELLLDDQNWRGNLNVQDIVDRYAEVVRGNIVLILTATIN